MSVENLSLNMMRKTKNGFVKPKSRNVIYYFFASLAFNKAISAV